MVALAIGCHPFLGLYGLLVCAGCALLMSFLMIRALHDPLSRLCSACLGYGLPVALLVVVWLFLTVNVPYWDDYEAILGYLANPYPERLSHIFDFHNEHRLVTMRIAADCLTGILGHFDFRVFMAIGQGLFCIYAWCWWRVYAKAGTTGKLLFVPCLWLLLSFIHYENLCWAMTSVSNVVVILLAFLAILAFRRRGNVWWFVLSLACGILATFSTGTGMFVWPCLVGMEVIEPLTCTRSWKEGLPRLLPNLKSRHVLIRLGLVGVIGTICVLAYFHGFPVSHDAMSVPREMHGLVTRMLFVVAFLGGAIQVPLLALGLGLALVVAFVFLVYRLPRLGEDIAIFVFLVFLLGGMMSASIFRATSWQAAVASRYCILSVSALTALTFLVSRQILIPARIFRWGLGLGTGCVVFYALAFLVLGGPQFAKRNEIMRRNILTWPTTTVGLRTSQPEQSGKLLERCLQRGIYDPRVVLNPGEQPPRTPVPWLR